MRELRYFEGRCGSRIEKTTIDREGERPHRLIVNYLRSPRADRHHCGEKYTCRVHEDRTDRGEPAAELGIVHHYFSVFLMTQRDVTPVHADMPNAFGDVLTASDEDVLLHRGHQKETDRTDHPDLRVEIGIHQNSAKGAWDKKKTYQETTDYRQDYTSNLLHRALTENQRPRADRLQEPAIQLDAVVPTVCGFDRV